MPPHTIPAPDILHAIHLAPEVLLSLWGLIVLALDFGPLRKESSERRGRLLGLISLLGAVIALASSFLPSLIVTGGITVDEPALFEGTLLGGYAVQQLNAFIIVLLIFVLGLSMTWDFTDHWGEYYALTIWAGVGMMFLIAAEEFITLFLTLEMMTICLYIITAFEKNRRRSVEGGLKYFVYGSVSSALFLFGLSILYGITGSTRLDAIGVALVNYGKFGLAGNVAGSVAVLLILVGFGFKLAAVPFHQWAPDAYEGAPAPVAAWIATGSKIAGVIALLKVLVQSLGPWASLPHNAASPGWVGLVAVIAAVTMTYGNFAALVQNNFKRMLAYSSIAHAGYMLVGVLAAIVSPDSRASANVLFYLVVYGFTNIGAFALAAWLYRDKQSDDIDDLSGLARQSPLLALCTLLLMLSLIGMPPLAGFFGKLTMFMGAINASDSNKLTFLWLVFLGFMNSVISAFYYVRVIKVMYLRPVQGKPFQMPTRSIQYAIVLSALVNIYFGLNSAPLVDDTRLLADSKMFLIGGQRKAPENPDAKKTNNPTAPMNTTPAASAPAPAAGAAANAPPAVPSAPTPKK